MKARLAPGSTLYISGKMTGLPCYNFKNFFYWQVKFEKSGYKVINPAENDCLKMLAGAPYKEADYDEVLEEDCRLIREEADAIFVIGKEYVTSTGAQKEISVAIECGKHVYYECDPKG